MEELQELLEYLEITHELNPLRLRLPAGASYAAHISVAFPSFTTSRETTPYHSYRSLLSRLSCPHLLRSDNDCLAHSHRLHRPIISPPREPLILPSVLLFNLRPPFRLRTCPLGPETATLPLRHILPISLRSCLAPLALTRLLKLLQPQHYLHRQVA